ncbi:hypothetical protein A3C18_04075 [Candidatus Kaiserbacteria bacterium RIFCSPHIGHO2_02_FULL_54_11b]|uniref:Uncharacterized protein n=1 Tax=Candidatus Kaiserbacteria bacterium RIFCSPHIGHO2_02_FULL_54_11b TaxID=1798494 RepID=A0A1F6DSU6_9BACT|nr:MAG: hypothetical protein A3C18_04075 [Candidatus Kaiserbacteria bacterium RIFCSPHIGHO2_02_FULL_54_11b]
MISLNHMKKFLAIYLGTMEDDSFKKWMAMPEAERKEIEQKGMAAWMKWGQDHAASIIDNGSPIGKTKRTDKNGVADTKNAISGYAVVQAETHEEAAKMFENHPHFTIFPGTSVEIMECLPMPTMSE